MMMPPTIYQYIKAEEARFQTEQVKVGDNWYWNFRDHVQLIFHLKNGVFYTGENNWLRAFKNVMEPMLNLAYWMEDIEVKDVVFFIENSTGRVLSFLLKTYHDEIFTREYNLDTLFDEITESDVDYGGTLVQKSKTGLPEVTVLNDIAFCNQNNILSAPLALKRVFAPESLRDMAASGWGDESNGATISIEDLIVLSEGDIEVYIFPGVGSLPEAYLKDNDNFDDHYPQVQVVAFYTDKEKRKQGVTLYRARDDGDRMRFHTSKKVHMRALGRGTGEALLPDQIWANFLEIHKTQMLEAAAKVPLVTDDETYTNKNKVRDMENLEITTIAEGKTIQRVPTAGVENIQLFENAIETWYAHAQLVASAFDPVLGKEQASGTTFKGQERTVAQGRGLHDRRRGQRSKFIEELYRDFIIPKMISEITDGTKFLATLSKEDLQWVVEQVTINHVNQRIKDGMLKGELMTPEERDLAADVFRQSFLKNGGKHLVEILKDDFKDIEVRVGINIAGKQKDLVNLSDKMLSIFQFIFANPTGFQAAMQIPALATAFDDLLEFSGINQSDFSTLMSTPAPAAALPAPAPAVAQPAQPLGAPAAPAA